MKRKISLVLLALIAALAPAALAQVPLVGSSLAVSAVPSTAGTSAAYMGWGKNGTGDADFFAANNGSSPSFEWYFLLGQHSYPRDVPRPECKPTCPQRRHYYPKCHGDSEHHPAALHGGHLTQPGNNRRRRNRGSYGLHGVYRRATMHRRRLRRNVRPLERNGLDCALKVTEGDWKATMANIIDTLIVALKLDASSLDKGASGAGAKLKGLESQGAKTSGEVKKLGDTSKSSASAVGELGSAVGKFLALLGGTYAIKAFVSDLIDSSAALDRLSKNLNVSAGEITAWGNAAEELGGKASGVQASMSMLSKAQTQIAITGESSLVPYFNFLGVSLASADGKASQGNGCPRRSLICGPGPRSPNHA